MVNTSDFTEGSWTIVPSVDLPVEGSMSQEDVEAAVEACAQQMLQPDIAATPAGFVLVNPTPPGQPIQYAPEQPAVETHSAQQTVVPKAKAKKATSKTSGVHTVQYSTMLDVMDAVCPNNSTQSAKAVLHIPSTAYAQDTNFLGNGENYRAMRPGQSPPLSKILYNRTVRIVCLVHCCHLSIGCIVVT